MRTTVPIPIVRAFRTLTLGAGFAVLLTGPMAPGACAAPPSIQLVETFPIETSLDNPDIPEAFEVWVAMIDGATSSLDFAEFYASDSDHSRLGGVIEAVERAATRGVRVRFLAEKVFYGTYPETLDRLGAVDGIEMRILDTGASMGGVLHAKYFLVDGREAYVGSQNFDWRSLEHIQELGVRVDEPGFVARLGEVFAADWTLAASDGSRGVPPSRLPAAVPATVTVVGGDATGGAAEATIVPAFSPSGWLPDQADWDLPKIVALIDSARTRVQVQLLPYNAVDRDHSYFPDLESALRGAAARGVEVQLLVSHWSQRRGTIEGLQSLQTLPGIEVKLLTIPEWSGGFIPYARVVHAKYLVVDGTSAWVGTSNWQADYFLKSRNVGLVAHGAAFAGRLQRYFERGWQSAYAEPVDACGEYAAPRVGR